MEKQITDFFGLGRELKLLATPLERKQHVAKAFQQLFQLDEAFPTPQFEASLQLIAEIPIDDELIVAHLMRAYQTITGHIKQDGTPAFTLNGVLMMKPGELAAFPEIILQTLKRHQRLMLTYITQGDVNLAVNSEPVAQKKAALSTLIQEQMEKLIPVAIEAFDGFRFIAFDLVDPSLSEREKVAGTKSVLKPEGELQKEIAFFKKSLGKGEDQEEVLNTLGNSMRALKIAYAEKRDAFQSDERRDTSGLEAILNEQIKRIDVIEQVLKILSQAIKSLPYLETRLDHFSKSLYQAKSVMQFFEEISKEVRDIFRNSRLETFKLIGALNYRLKSSSFQFWCIENYAAMEKMREILEERIGRTMIQSLLSKYENVSPEVIKKNSNVMRQIEEKIKERMKDFEEHLEQMYQGINQINSLNSEMHQTLMGFQKKASQYTPDYPKEQKTADADNLEKQLVTLLGKIKRLFDRLADEQNGVYGKAKSIFSGFIRSTLVSVPIYQQLLQCFESLQQQELDYPLNITKEDLSPFQEEAMAKNLQRHTELEKIYYREILCMLNRTSSEIENHDNKEELVKIIGKNLSPIALEAFLVILQSIPKRSLPLMQSAGKNLLEIASAYWEMVRGRFAGYVPSSQREATQKAPLVKAHRLMTLYLEPIYKNINAEKEHTENFLSRYEQREKERWQEELDELVDFWKAEIQRQIATPPRFRTEKNYKKMTDREVDSMAKHISIKQFIEIEDFLEVQPGAEIHVSGEKALLFIAKTFAENLDKNYDDVSKTATQKQKQFLRSHRKANNVTNRILLVGEYRTVIIPKDMAIEEKKALQTIDSFLKARIANINKDNEITLALPPLQPEQIVNIGRNLGKNRMLLVAKICENELRQSHHKASESLVLLVQIAYQYLTDLKQMNSPLVQTIGKEILIIADAYRELVPASTSNEASKS